MSRLNRFTLELMFADQLQSNTSDVVFVIDFSSKTINDVRCYSYPIASIEDLVQVFEQFTVVKHNGSAPLLIPKVA